MSDSNLSVPHDALSNNIVDSSPEEKQLPAVGDAGLQQELSPSPPTALQSYQKAVAEYLFLLLGEKWVELEVFSPSYDDLGAQDWLAWLG